MDNCSVVARVVIREDCVDGADEAIDVTAKEGVWKKDHLSFNQICSTENKYP